MRFESSFHDSGVDVDTQVDSCVKSVMSVINTGTPVGANAIHFSVVCTTPHTALHMVTVDVKIVIMKRYLNETQPLESLKKNTPPTSSTKRKNPSKEKDDNANIIKPPRERHHQPYHGTPLINAEALNSMRVNDYLVTVDKEMRESYASKRIEVEIDKQDDDIVDHLIKTWESMGFNPVRWEPTLRYISIAWAWKIAPTDPIESKSTIETSIEPRQCVDLGDTV